MNHYRDPARAGVQGAEEYKQALQSLTKEANASLFQHVEECLDGFEQGDRSQLTVGPARAHCEAGVKQLLAIRNSFIARNVDLLVMRSRRLQERSRINAASPLNVLA